LRRDIQFLRGIAVLVVVLYHSNLGILSQGYLGVDVFFVLSGFLITSIILKGLDNNSFLFSVFYLRRAKRLLPALYSTLLFTTLLCLIVLTSSQWLEYLDQLIGALTFTANMVLPSQVGYFESASEGKPLLHIWSLSLEEQYYFLLPITLFFLPKNYRLFGLTTLTALSLYWCFSWVYSESQYAPFLWRVADSSKSEWAFYLLFTRAWELLGGSLCAWLMLNKPHIEVPKFLKVMSLIIICLSCAISINSEHPSIESVIVVISTMVILTGKQEWLPKHFVIRFIEKAGDWSYSIYLVHWPLFAFAYLSYVGDVPTSIKIVLLITSIILGYLQFRYVETPFRIGKFKNLCSSWKVAVTATIILLAIPVTSAYTLSTVEDEFSHIRRINHGLGRECEGSFDDNKNLKSDCITGEEPNVAIWGDSYAMHLVPGLTVKNKQLAQITKSACGPILGLAPITNKYDSVWAKTCLEFNTNAMNYIKNHPNITHVVLSSTLGQYLNFTETDYLTGQGTVEANHKLFSNAFRDTILALKKLNIIPIVISPPPKSGFNVGECLEREHGAALLLREHCYISYPAYQQHQKRVNETLKEIEKVTKVIWLKDYLCGNETCEVYKEGTFIYRDGGHLSIDGSINLLKNIEINTFK
jgi:peptidoglycan/LPS O-acetylase OafA/YrhL